VSYVRRVLLVVLFGSAMLAFAPTAEARTHIQVVSRVRTSDAVVFITIDDGFHRTRDAAATLERLKWPVTSFVLPKTLGAGKTSYFKSLGSRSEFGNHTVDHTDMRKLSVAAQRKQICRADKQLTGLVGSPTTMFRPPFGSYDSRTLDAAAACGMTHLVMWRVTVSGSEIRTWGGSIRRGDIILLHYVPSLGRSLDALARELSKLGLKPALLSEYLD
jgi:peptidoglycan/xylan/chitin deacetylase (PgdA/CDA1 family)